MAQISKDWSGDTVGASPAGVTAWIEGALSDLSVANDGTSNYVEKSLSTGARHAFTVDAASSTDATEVYMEFEFASVTEADARMVLRLDSTKNTFLGDASVVLVGLRPDRNEFQAFQYVDGNPTTLASPSVTGLQVNTRYSQIATLTAANYLTASYWETSGSEPATPQIDQSISVAASLDSGLVGFGGFDAAAIKIYYIGIGTAGDSAPRPSAGPSVTIDPTNLPLTPGATFNFTYSDYDTVPTTLTVSDGTNTITIASPTITDNGDGTGSGSGAMPALPTTGTASLIQFTDSATVELT